MWVLPRFPKNGITAFLHSHDLLLHRDRVTTMHPAVVASLYPFDSSGDPSKDSLLQNSVTSTNSVQDQTSPSSLHSALAAFQSAGSRRRWKVEGEEGVYKEREREIEAERARQQRIRDKAPGLRSTKGGEIDGMFHVHPFPCIDIPPIVLAVLERVKDGWEFIIDPDVCKPFLTG